MCVVTYANWSTVSSDQGPRNSSWQEATFVPLSLALALNTIFHPNFEGEHPGVCQRPPTSLTLPPTSREDLWFDGYLRVPPCCKGATHLQVSMPSASLPTIPDGRLLKYLN
ncbi:hypothetical protein TNCV_3283351 [Trichonephila clavipes]|nr:hypothetical protein TNCV_3283351 [Trichonephila clavipes]